MHEDFIPVPYRVFERVEENDDTVTLGLRPVGRPLPPFRPGQFAMLYAFGVGEIPISVSGLPLNGRLLRATVRAAGSVGRALTQALPGRMLGVRGPYGNDWTLRNHAHHHQPIGERAPLPGAGEDGGKPAPGTADGAPRTPLGTPRGGDVLVVAGGLGLAPLRPVVQTALAEPTAYGRIAVLYGARTLAELVYLEDLMHWHNGAQVRATVDEPDPTWLGRTGPVTELLDTVDLRPRAATAFVCGSEPMMRATATALTARGIAHSAIRISLERDLRCVTRSCGNCRLGPALVCRDGPVFTWAQAASLLAVRGDDHGTGAPSTPSARSPRPLNHPHPGGSRDHIRVRLRRGPA